MQPKALKHGTVSFCHQRAKLLYCVISLQLWESTTVIKETHSQWNKVSTESIEVNIFRVIYGSFWFISVCTWSTSAHFVHLCLCVPLLFFSPSCVTMLNIAVNSLSTNCPRCLRTNRARPIMDNTAKLLIYSRISVNHSKSSTRRWKESRFKYYEWNEQQLQVSKSVTKAERMTACFLEVTKTC